MARAKAKIVEEFKELGGDMSAIPEDLDNIKAEELEKLVADLKAIKGLQDDAAAAAAGDKAAEGPKAPEAATQPAAAAATAPGSASQAKGFRLTKASIYGSAKLPGMTFVAGKFYPASELSEDVQEILRKTGFFSEV